MIRRGIRKLGRKLMGRGEAPSSPEPVRPAPPPPHTEPKETLSESPEPNVEVEADTLKEWVDGGREVSFIDIREPYELSSGHVEGALLLPMNQVPHSQETLPRERTLILYCAAGARSFGVAHYLREQGIEDAWSLVGGIGAWLQQGGQWLAPPSDAAFPLLTPVFVSAEVARSRGVDCPDKGAAGTVQAVRDTPRRYDVLLSRSGGAPVTLHDLEEASLAPVGRRPLQ